MNKKAVITILGLAGGKIDKKNNILHPINFKAKHTYYFQENESIKKYSNTLPILIDKYHKEYSIIPIFTKEAKLVQSKILEENENKKDFLYIFNDNYLIEDENDFDKLMILISKIIDKYDKVIVDITHGFRHLPILITITLLMENIKNINKVEHIWFAKEIKKAEPNIEGEYHIIDLKDYLELANLSFVITNFKDNFTISSNIVVGKDNYKELAKAMTNFSRDILALSLNNMYKTTYPILEKILHRATCKFPRTHTI